MIGPDDPSGLSNLNDTVIINPGLSLDSKQTGAELHLPLYREPRTGLASTGPQMPPELMQPPYCPLVEGVWLYQG